MRHVDLGYVRSTALRLFLPTWFTVYASVTLVHMATHNYLGVDLAIYRHAAELALSGGNPWAVEPSGTFAGPPPTVLLYLPAALLPLPVATVLMSIAAVGAAVWAVHRLGLPLWWLLFPPLFDAFTVGNPDAFVLPLLLVRGPLAGLAAVFKVYALVPLLAQRRWSAIVVALVASVLSLPLLPTFLGNLGTVEGTLGGAAKLSAWGTWLIVPVIAALWLLRDRGAAWLIVPAIWPNTHGHYGTMALPAVRHYPLAAALIGLNIPLMPPLAVILMAAEDWLRARRNAFDRGSADAGVPLRDVGAGDTLIENP
jgi:hypothetical protein